MPHAAWRPPSRPPPRISVSRKGIRVQGTTRVGSRTPPQWNFPPSTPPLVTQTPPAAQRPLRSEGRVASSLRAYPFHARPPPGVSYRLQLPPLAPPLPVPVPWKDEGQDMREVRRPGRSPVSTASARSMGRCGGRSGSARSALSE